MLNRTARTAFGILIFFTALSFTWALGSSREKGEAPAKPKTFVNSVGMKFVRIPAGSFLMGTPPEEPDRDKDEGPVRLVKISRPFWLGVHEVTQAQWVRVMGKNPSTFRHPKSPVDSVSWYDCRSFIGRLNEMEDTQRYRLPTEAEWEYAARAGTVTAYYFGNDPGLLADNAWYNKNSDGKSHTAGLKPPNPFGLYDMHGNLWEWCQDPYRSDYYKEGPSVDPTGPKTGRTRVLRGGSWLSFASYLRSGYRHSAHPSDLDFNYGFRVVKE